MLEVKSLVQQYTYGAVGINGLSFCAAEGDVVSILGGGEAGKTSLLKCLAGLYPIKSGEVFIDGEKPDYKNPKNLGVMLVHSDGGFFERKSLAYNLAYPLLKRKTDRKIIEERLNSALERLDLKEFINARIDSLSAKNRVKAAAARLLMRKAKVYLIDDIFKSLDYRDKMEVFYSILPIIKELKGVVVYATSDPDEAFSLSDEVIIMNYGCEADRGSRESISNNPQSLVSYKYSAPFDVNIITATLQKGSAGGVYVNLPGITAVLNDDKLMNNIYIGSEAVCAFKLKENPEGIPLTPDTRYMSYCNNYSILLLKSESGVLKMRYNGENISAVSADVASLKIFDKISERPIYSGCAEEAKAD